MKKKSGNISILVIFVLLASSLLGILSMNYVQQMMKQSSAVQSYYKSYYLAKAGIELSLTQITSRGVGFEYTVNTGDAIVLENFISGANYSLSTHISGTAMLLSENLWQNTGCSSRYTLLPGESFIIPLFRDSTSGNVATTLDSPSVYQNLAHIFKAGQIQILSDFGGDATFGILILSGDEVSENGVYFQTGNLNDGLPTFRKAFENYLSLIDPQLYPADSQWDDNYNQSDFGYRLYLLISNRSALEEAFCIAVEQPTTQAPGQIDVLPTDTFFIQSQASYGGQKVFLDASYAQPIPAFLFSTYSNY